MPTRLITLCLAFSASVIITCQGLKFNISTILQPTGCAKPDPLSNGKWFCTGKSDEFCHLECAPGYAANGLTSITQSKDCSWTVAPNTLSCSTAVALIIGGLFDVTGAEVYGPNLHYRLPNLPDTRIGSTLDYVDSHIIACGGSMIKGPPIPPIPLARNSCIEMKDDLTWSFYSNMHHGRDVHTSAVNLGKLTLLGGTDAPMSRDTIEPGKSKEWTEEKIKKTKYSCATKISPTQFVVTGGEYHPAEVLKYNALTGEKTKLADLTQMRSGHGCAYIKHGSMVGVMVAGGLPKGKEEWTTNVTRATTNSAEFYSIYTEEWEVVGKLNEARRGLRLVFVQDTLYAMGGFNGKNYVATVEKFDFRTKTWSKVENMLEVRAFQSVVAVPKSKFLAHH